MQGKSEQGSKVRAAKFKPDDRITDMSEVRLFTPAECAMLKLVHSGDERSAHLQVYRALRTQLFKQSKSANFICMVTSVMSGGGSYVAMNLASTISLDKSKSAIYVDANLYSPSAERVMTVPAHTGLTDFLDDESLGVEDIVYASGIKRMRVVPIGNNREGGTEKLGSARMKNLFDELGSRYKDRYAILDAPPIDDYDAEVSILADLCDLVLLVVPYGRATDAQLKNAIDKIGRDRLTGVVFNRC